MVASGQRSKSRRASGFGTRAVVQRAADGVAWRVMLTAGLTERQAREREARRDCRTRQAVERGRAGARVGRSAGTRSTARADGAAPGGVRRTEGAPTGHHQGAVDAPRGLISQIFAAVTGPATGATIVAASRRKVRAIARRARVRPHLRAHRPRLPRGSGQQLAHAVKRAPPVVRRGLRYQAGR